VSVPPAAYEFLAAPAAFVLAFLHARRALGGRRAALELLALVAYGYALEWVAIVVFASHVYGPSWRLAPGGVPLAVAVTWAAVIASAIALAARLRASPLDRALVAALLGICLDLLMEPVAVARALWTWTPAGPWLGVPIGNFVGWGVIVGAYAFGAERFGGGASLATQAGQRAALGLVSVGVLVTVGLAWRALGVESAFTGAGGWLAALGLYAATFGCTRTRRSAAEGSGLATRLGRTEGRSPALVLLLLAVPFTLDAGAGGDPRLLAVALLSLAVLGAAASGTSLASYPAPSPSD
jgi:uncharacterized membrane protein